VPPQLQRRTRGICRPAKRGAHANADFESEMIEQAAYITLTRKRRSYDRLRHRLRIVELQAAKLRVGRATELDLDNIAE